MHLGMVVCAFCLADKNLLYLFLLVDGQPATQNEPNLIGLGLIGVSLLFIIVFWLVVAYR